MFIAKTLKWVYQNTPKERQDGHKDVNERSIKVTAAKFTIADNKLYKKFYKRKLEYKKTFYTNIYICITSKKITPIKRYVGGDETMKSTYDQVNRNK